MHEDERLLIGGQTILQFETIRNIAQSENYTQYIKVINILDSMVKGLGVAGIQPRFEDARRLKQMMNLELGAGGENDNSVPHYVQSLFHHFLMKTTEMVINLAIWGVHFFGYYEHIDMNGYGYKKFGKVFGFDDSEKLFDFKMLMKLFPNLVVLTIGDFEVGNAIPSIDLSSDFVLKVFECIEYLNTASSSLSFSRFEIIKPKSSITEFIKSMKDEFEMNGWKLKIETFVGKGIISDVGSQEMLLIEKMKN